MASAHLSAGKAVRKLGGPREDNALHLEHGTPSVKSSECKEEEEEEEEEEKEVAFVFQCHDV